eukprot:TRINITY_DN38533_c0_g1_i1.p1 TRINITY_DN38533_c0_g1~~TRINITY_DN38533_c0_g1_i1.p1  ORF type:complete len:352 (-),score=67.21 TRINITY_DN38533_c0_g1_i1:208-1239(-)
MPSWQRLLASLRTPCCECFVYKRPARWWYRGAPLSPRGLADGQQRRSCMSQRIFREEVSYEVKDGIAIIDFVSVDGQFEWGTKKEEHRWNPVLVGALGDALDAAESDEGVNVVVVTNEGKFWSNGMDLKFLEKCKPAESADLGRAINELMVRVCCFPVPTVAAIRGHFCAAGGMMGLSFDYRLMSDDRGFFFIPGVDLGLVYGRLQTAVMAAKLPQSMHRDVILFNSKRWTAAELVDRGVVDITVKASEVLPRALELAESLRPKGRGPARNALGGIKRGLYKDVLEALTEAGDDLMDLSGTTKGVDRPPAPASQPASAKASPILGPGSAPKAPDDPPKRESKL